MHLVALHRESDLKWFLSNAEACKEHGIDIVLHEGLLTRGPTPTRQLDGTLGYSYKPQVLTYIPQVLDRAAVEDRMVYSYWHPEYWGLESGTYRDALYWFEFGSQTGVTRSDGVFIDGCVRDAHCVGLLARAMTIRPIMHCSLQAHSWNGCYPGSIEHCGGILIGEQPTFEDIDDPDLPYRRNPYGTTFLKWPKNHYYTTDAEHRFVGWATRWVKHLKGSLWMDTQLARLWIAYCRSQK